MKPEIRNPKFEIRNPIEGLDHAFLRWLPVVPEDQKAYQSFYLRFFEDCKTIVDLGCGEGNFVELLTEHGIQAIGVDFDRQCCEAAWERGINVVYQDALTYLAEADAESFDGVFSAHLVEHLPYETVIELIRRSYRVLKPGGVIVLTTPNVRGLFSHLEMFYIHFGHVTFYHPRLLCFFLEFAGFAEPESGENPTQPHPLCGDILHTLTTQQNQQTDSQPTITPISYEPKLPKPANPLRRLIWHGKMFLVKLIVQPYLDHFMTEINRGFGEINQEFNRTNTALDHSLAQFLATMQQLDRPFEAYATARKPEEIPS
ncbi:MAG: class I SAM-dependent methyltransferase [Anaerolineae bacterium]